MKLGMQEIKWATSALNNHAMGCECSLHPELIKRLLEHKNLLKNMYPAQHLMNEGDVAIIIAQFKRDFPELEAYQKN